MEHWIDRLLSSREAHLSRPSPRPNFGGCFSGASPTTGDFKFMGLRVRIFIHLIFMQN